MSQAQFWDFIDGVDTDIVARGIDGETPTIEIDPFDKTWIIDGVDTGTKAEGEDGETPTITIGDNGNWFVDGVDTGKAATIGESIYSVRFDANGGSFDDGTNVIVYRVYSGMTITELPVPQRSGYDFLGWFTGTGENDGRFFSTTEIHQDYELVARYESTSFSTVSATFVNVDGEVLYTEEEVSYGTAPSYSGADPAYPSEAAPAQDGYEYAFTGWLPEIGSIYEDTIFVAQYEERKISYDITFSLGEEYEQYPATDIEVSVKAGEAIEAPEIDLSLVEPGLGLASFSCEGQTYDASDFPLVPASDMVFEASWEPTDSLFEGTYESSLGGMAVSSFAGEDFIAVSFPERINDNYGTSRPIVSIGDHFRWKGGLKQILLPDTVKTIGVASFAHSKFKSFKVPSSLMSIGESAFYDSSLVEIDFTSIVGSFTAIPEKAFAASDDLVRLVANSNLDGIGARAFEGCSSLASVTLEEGLATIGDQAFKDCYSLKEIVIPASVVTMGAEVFAGDDLDIFLSDTSYNSDWTEGWNDYNPYYLYSYSEPTGDGFYWHRVYDYATGTYFIDVW